MEHLWCERGVKVHNRDVKILTLPEEAMKTSWQMVPLPRSSHVPHIPHIYRPPFLQAKYEDFDGPTLVEEPLSIDELKEEVGGAAH